MARQVGLHVTTLTIFRSSNLEAAQVGFLHLLMGNLIVGRRVTIGAGEVSAWLCAMGGVGKSIQIDHNWQCLARWELDLARGFAMAQAASSIVYPLVYRFGNRGKQCYVSDRFGDGNRCSSSRSRQPGN
jgi:hypothetical protein